MRTTGPERTASSSAQECFPDTNSDFGELSRLMLSKLSSTIEGDVIPRLMLAFEPANKRIEAPSGAHQKLADVVDEFVHLILAHDANVANEYVSALRAEGVPLSAIYLDLLAPAARRLGEMWEEDECTFTDVTIGVCRLHEVLLEFSRCFDDRGAATSANGMNALMVPALGEQHTFGLFVVVEFLRRGGWNCWSGTPVSLRDFRRLLQARNFDAVGISVSADRNIDTAAEQIAEIRRHATGDVAVVVGGRPFVANPGLARDIGADGTANDGHGAVQQITDLCRTAKRKAPK